MLLELEHKTDFFSQKNELLARKFLYVATGIPFHIYMTIIHAYPIDEVPSTWRLANHMAMKQGSLTNTPMHTFTTLAGAWPCGLDVISASYDNSYSYSQGVYKDSARVSKATYYSFLQDE